jgi:hypothetical protein
VKEFYFFFTLLYIIHLFILALLGPQLKASLTFQASALPLEPWPKSWLKLFFFFFFLVGLGFELRASNLQSRRYTAWVIPSVHFALVILEMGSCELFAQGWPQTLILLTSVSQEARIIGVSYCAQLKFLILVTSLILELGKCARIPSKL